MVSHNRWVSRLSWALVVLAVISAVVALMFALGYLRPPHDEADFVERLVANRNSDTEAFPFVVLGSLASVGVFLIAALLGVALRVWAPATPQRDAMTTLLVIGGVLGIGANLLNIAVGEAATIGYCDCGYRTEEVIGLNYALTVGWSGVNWLTIGAVTLVGVGVAIAGRIIDVSPAWQTVSYLIAALLIVAVALRVIAAFIFIQAFDPSQISDLLTAVAVGILVPIWAILLARGVGRSAPEPATAA